MKSKYLKLVKPVELKDEFMGSTYSEFLEYFELQHDLQSIKKIESVLNSLFDNEDVVNGFASDDIAQMRALSHTNSLRQYIKSYLWMFFTDCIVANFPFQIMMDEGDEESLVLGSLFDDTKVYPIIDAMVGYFADESDYLTNRYLEIEAHCDNALDNINA